jgi:hypothetical protein
MLAREARVSLPTGAWRDGVCHRDAVVRAITGADEMVLLDGGDARPSAAWVTALLARCVERVGRITGEPSTDSVRGLTIGDREALLLHLRRLTFGDRLECVLACPVCCAPLESELSVQGLLLPPYGAPREWYNADVTDGTGGVYYARFRLPTGADQEAVAGLATSDSHGAADVLFRQCILELRQGESRIDVATAELAPAVVERIGALLSELDPQAELTLDLSCAACGHAFTVLFDIASYLCQELEARGGALYRDVHTLALHYHWSESEIIGMTSAKRGRYLDLIAESIAEPTV